MVKGLERFRRRFAGRSAGFVLIGVDILLLAPDRQERERALEAVGGGGPFLKRTLREVTQ